MRKCKLLFIVLVLGLLSPVLAAPYTGWQSDYVAPQPASTLYLWNMEHYDAGPPETTNDVITGATNALTFGSANVTRSTAAGKWGYGVTLPGTNVGTDELYALTTTDFSSEDTSLSVECWAKSADGIPYINSTTNNVDFLVCKSTGFYNNAVNGVVMMFNRDKTSGGLYFRGGMGTGPQATGDFVCAQVDVATIAGFDVMNWNHYAFTWDASIDTFRLYINGEKVGELVKADRTYVPNTDKELHVGQRVLSGYNGWNGDMDNVRLSDVAYEYAPEPATIAMLVCGGLLMMRRRRA